MRSRPAAMPGGFTFAELLIALVIGGLVVTGAVIAFGTLATFRQNPAGVTIDVTLPGGTLVNFYGLTNNFISVETAPSYGETARAESMRELFERDIASAVAVFCLARNGRSALRPTNVSIPAGMPPRAFTNAFVFRDLIDPGAATFPNFTGAATNLVNTSVFILGPSDSASAASVRAIYEMDIVPAVQPQGFYASVRRYTGGSLAAYYHVFYEQTNTVNGFRPPLAYFERSALSTGGSDITNAFRAAANMPFYFIWWPDPAQRRLPTTPPPSFTGTARSVYLNMADATSFFLVAPAFPAL